MRHKSPFSGRDLWGLEWKYQENHKVRLQTIQNVNLKLIEIWFIKFGKFKKNI